jgi:hypothetical protein
VRALVTLTEDSQPLPDAKAKQNLGFEASLLLGSVPRTSPIPAAICPATPQNSSRT